MSRLPEFTHCYFVALDALCAGADPLDAAVHQIRPSGLLTGLEREIAVKASGAAIQDFNGQRARKTLDCRNAMEG